MGRLDGKVSLITGGARGMGKSHVRHFVAEGARVVFGDVQDDKGAAVADGLGGQLGRFGIRVNSVHPGGVLTSMTLGAAGAVDHVDPDAFVKAMPLSRFAEPVEISRLVAYLASDESSYSTGSEFVADGGLLSGPGY
jgi:NAD(P)-dependent dehydrogenase (short-subunit alcohol dehydrogenase family)